MKCDRGQVQNTTKWRYRQNSKEGSFLTARRHAGEGKAGNKNPLASRPKNVSNELTDHIPIQKSQSQNHIQTYNSTGRKGRIAVECFSERRRSSLTVQWASSIYITWWNPTNDSEIVPCYQNFVVKGVGGGGWERYKAWTWERRDWCRELKGENLRRCVLLHTSGWVTTVQKRHKTNEIRNDPGCRENWGSTEIQMPENKDKEQVQLSIFYLWL